MILTLISEIRDFKNEFKNEFLKLNDEFLKFKEEDMLFKEADMLFKKTYEPVWLKAGHVFEIVGRERLVRMRGESFGKPFEVRKLNGLDRLALPKDTTSGTARTHITRAYQLGLKAESLLLDFRVDVSKLENIGVKNSSEAQLKKYDALLRVEEKQQFIVDQPLGLYIVSIQLFKDNLC